MARDRIRLALVVGVLLLVFRLLLGHTGMVWASEQKYLKEYCRAEALLYLNKTGLDLTSVRCELKNFDSSLDFKVLGVTGMPFLYFHCNYVDELASLVELRDCAFSKT